MKINPHYNPREAAKGFQETVAETRARYASQLEALMSATTEERHAKPVLNDIEWLIYTVERLCEIVLREVPEKH